MNRKRLAFIMLIISIGMGLLGASFFYQYSLGINVPIYLSLVTGIILLMGRLSEGNINRRNLWVVLPMLFFALMIAIRASTVLTGLNIIAVIALGTFFVRYLKSEKVLDVASIVDHIFTPLDVALYTIYAPLVETRHSFDLFRERSWKDVNHLGAIIRGLAFTIPILLVFGVLLGSADEVFANTFDGVFDWLFSANIYDIADPLLLAGVMGWLMLTALSYALARQIPQPQETSETSSTGLKKQRPTFRIGMIEATMVLGSVTLLFLFFVIIQFTYLFGGQANIADSLNYSQYARRGFFELVAVAVLVLGMILYFDRITLRQGSHQGIVFSILSIVIVGLTMVMLVSAWRRMELYELAYGFTYLRVLTHVFMFWLGVLLIFAILNVLRIRTNIFALGFLLSCIGYVGTLNLMNVDNYIAERNIQAYVNNEAEQELDICYLRLLSVDALPAMMHLYGNIPDNDSQQLFDHILWWLNHQRENWKTLRTDILDFHYQVLFLSTYMYKADMPLDTIPRADSSLEYACYGRFWF